MADVAGKSVLDLLWEHLDDFVDAVQEPVNEYEAAHAKGRAHGMAVAIAVVTNPYAPEVDEVKVQAMERWEERVAMPTLDDRATAARTRRSERREARLARRRSRNG